MSQVKLMVLYPQPTDIKQFEKDYSAHLILFHEKMNIPVGHGDYEVIKMHETPIGPSPYFQMFSLTFPSKQALQQTMASEEMQEVAADANRISSGGLPIILIGQDDR